MSGLLAQVRGSADVMAARSAGLPSRVVLAAIKNICSPDCSHRNHGILGCRSRWSGGRRGRRTSPVEHARDQRGSMRLRSFSAG